MQKSRPLSLRLQIRHFKNTFFQVGELPFQDLFPATLIKAMHQSGDVRETVFTPLVTLKAFFYKFSVPQVLVKRLSPIFLLND